MNLLLITNELGYRGTPRYLAFCAKIARTANFKTLVWGLDRGGYAAQLCADNGIPVIIGEGNLEQAIEFKPTVVHIHRGGGPSRRDRAILEKLKRQCCSRILETNVFGIVDFSPNLPIDLHAHISLWNLWRWQKWLWPLHKPGIFLPNCVDTDTFHPVQSEFRRLHNIPERALLVGRLGKTDWPLVANIANMVLSRRKDIWLATIDDYAYTDGFLSSIPDSLQSHIIHIPKLVGPTELCSFYSACDLTLNFSPIGESFGYGIAESMACGTPVVVQSKPRNDNAQIELAAPCYGGFPVADATSAAQTILELAVDRKRLADASKKCRPSIEQRYSIHVQASPLLKTYELLSETDATGRKLENMFFNAGFKTSCLTSKIRHQFAAVRGTPITTMERLKMNLAYSLPNAIRHYLEEYDA